MLCAIAAATGLQAFVEQAVLFREQPGVVASAAITAVRYLLLAWLVAVLIGGIGGAVTRRFALGKGSLDAALIRLCFRILSIIGALLVVVQAANEFGLSITPIIAGLGIGGLAVALAIRPTLENIIGGFVLFADRPVRVWESSNFGDRVGTVEEIGLRSTRVRGLDRTVITVPNADFAQLQIVNYTRRDMNLFQSSIGLRYETTPDQLRYVAAKIRKLLIQPNKVVPDPARVRLSAFGNSAFVLDVFAFVRAADWNEFLAIEEDLNLRIAEIVRKSGTGFAFPSRTVYFSRDSGVDGARTEEAEGEVGDGARRSGCHFRNSISPSAPRWPTPCLSRPKARRTFSRAQSRPRRRATAAIHSSAPPAGSSCCVDARNLPPRRILRPELSGGITPGLSQWPRADFHFPNNAIKFASSCARNPGSVPNSAR